MSCKVFKKSGDFDKKSLQSRKANFRKGINIFVKMLEIFDLNRIERRKKKLMEIFGKLETSQVKVREFCVQNFVDSLWLCAM